MLAKPRRITLADGITTRMIDTGGEGEPLVLIHGLAASIEIWDKVTPALAAQHRVLAFDLPGFGEADKLDASYDAPFFVRQLQAFLDANGIERAHLVGSSLGASLIIRYGAQHPGCIASATLAAPGGFGAGVHPFLRVPTLPLVGYAMATPMRPTNTFAVRLAMADKRNATRELIDLADRSSKLPGAHRAFYRTLKAVVGPLGVKDRDSFERDAASLKCPTVLAWGEQDRLFSVRQSERAMQILPQARLLRLERCGHYPQWEQPRLFAEAVLKLASSSS